MNEKAMHTPGPWHYSEADYEGSGVYLIGDAEGLAIGEVRSFNPEQDAALIAAAPALYEALAKLLSYNEDIIAGRINYRPEDHAQVARAALSAAKKQD